MWIEMFYDFRCFLLTLHISKLFLHIPKYVEYVFDRWHVLLLIHIGLAQVCLQG